MSVLILSGAGCLGPFAVEALLDTKHDVAVLVNQPIGDSDNLGAVGDRFLSKTS